MKWYGDLLGVVCRLFLQFLDFASLTMQMTATCTGHIKLTGCMGKIIFVSSFSLTGTRKLIVCSVFYDAYIFLVEFKISQTTGQNKPLGNFQKPYSGKILI